jgi:hypothetical protein
MRPSSWYLQFLAYAVGMVAAGALVGLGITRGRVELALTGLALIVVLACSIGLWLSQTPKHGV